MTPQSRKSGHGLLLGCRSGLDAGPFEKTFVDDVRKKNIGQKPGKSSPSVRVQHRNRNRSGVVENGVTKSCQIFRQKTGKTQFWPKVFHLFEQDEDRLLFARVGVTEFPTNTAEIEKEKSWVRDSFFKSGCASHYFFIFLAAEKLTLGGGVTSKMAS